MAVLILKHENTAGYVRLMLKDIVSYPLENEITLFIFFYIFIIIDNLYERNKQRSFGISFKIGSLLVFSF